eukprot:Hpha_TRINITY_DN15533_c3_g6::TRINITY_DN15533_c3_g6_i1::g.105245::m.105245
MWGQGGGRGGGDTFSRISLLPSEGGERIVVFLLTQPLRSSARPGTRHRRGGSAGGGGCLSTGLLLLRSSSSRTGGLPLSAAGGRGTTATGAGALPPARGGLLAALTTLATTLTAGSVRPLLTTLPALPAAATSTRLPLTTVVLLMTTPLTTTPVAPATALVPVVVSVVVLLGVTGTLGVLTLGLTDFPLEVANSPLATVGGVAADDNLVLPVVVGESDEAEGLGLLLALPEGRLLGVTAGHEGRSDVGVDLDRLHVRVRRGELHTHLTVALLLQQPLHVAPRAPPLLPQPGKEGDLSNDLQDTVRRGRQLLPRGPPRAEHVGELLVAEGKGVSAPVIRALEGLLDVLREVPRVLPLHR